MKKILALPLAILMLASCDVPVQDIIKINGDLEQTIEVNSEYVDLGIIYPEEKYALVITGEVNVTRLGRYEIKYSLFTRDGELHKELYRFVNVVDTTAPLLEEAANTVFYAGFTYPVSYFVSDYSDNYNSKSSIAVSPSSFLFTSPGIHDVVITFEDSSGNVASYSKSIDVQLDMVNLINEVYKNTKWVVTTTQFSGEETYVNVSIDAAKSLGYFESGSIHYLETVTTTLGKSASIQISADYGDFGKATLDYHISSNNSMNYAYGMVRSFDATQLDSRISFFNLFSENGYQVNEAAALSECNERLGDVLAHFHDYFENTLHLEVK